MSERRLAWGAVGPAIAVALALAVAGFMLLRGDDGDESSGAGPPVPVEVTSDAPRHATLEDLVTAADVVLTGEVVGTDRGRIFGDPDSDAAIESRLVTLEVTEVLVRSPAADLSGGDTVLVEEEGWTLDGAPLVVDGLAPSAVGDSGFWFLQQVEGPAGPAYVVVSAQGRYLVDPAGHLDGADGDDPLVSAIVALSPASLADDLRAMAR